LLAPYLENALRSKPIIDVIDSSTFGAKMPRADWGFVGNPQLAFPPASEQSAIIRFLDHCDRRIRRYISAKRKLIALLNEQKRAIIHRVVTRGLDPNVRLKPSGVEWLGDVPEHWEVLQLRRRWRVTDCKHVTVPFVENGVPLASVREVQSFELDLSAAKGTTDEWYSFLISGQRAPMRGDLIYCRNVSVGACAYVGTNDRFAMGQDVCLIRSKIQNGRFLNYVMHSSTMQRQLSLLLIGSTFNRINVSDIKSLVLALPPRSEQDLIASQLDSQISVFDGPIRTAEREIDLLREYRTRLIADVVTGKLDVRGAAAKLPEEVEVPEPVEEIEALAEGGDTISEADLEAQAEPAAA
jgi:type I restriction enzyme S subunit